MRKSEIQSALESYRACTGKGHGLKALLGKAVLADLAEHLASELPTPKLRLDADAFIPAVHHLIDAGEPFPSFGIKIVMAEDGQLPDGCIGAIGNSENPKEWLLIKR